MASRLVLCLLCVVGASAGKLQVSRVARQAAKSRLGGDITELVRALNHGLVVDAQPSMVPIAELARQRLGMEAAELEQESLPEAMMLRAFAGSAPDSMFVMPSEMIAGPAMPSGFMIVEQKMSVPAIDVKPMEREPSVATHFKKESSVKDAVKHLTSEMRTIEENMGRKALEDIISAFFSESEAKKLEKEPVAKKVEEKPAEIEAKDSAVNAEKQSKGSLKIQSLSSSGARENKGKAAMVERVAQLSHPAHSDAKAHALAAKNEHSGMAQHRQEMFHAPTHSAAKAAAPTKKSAPVHAAAKTEHHVAVEHSHEKHHAPAHSSAKAAAPTTEVEHRHQKQKAPAASVANAAAMAKKAAPAHATAKTTPRAMVEHSHQKHQEPAHSVAKVAALAKQAAPAAQHHAGEWPTGNKDATWRDETTFFQRKCNGKRCVVRMIPRRK